MRVIENTDINWRDEEYAYDLESALQENGYAEMVGDIARVVVMLEGENDGADWHWLCAMKDESFALIEGGCDYTGWD